MFDIVKSFIVPLNSLDEIYKAFPNEYNCIKYLEQYRWNDKPQSPFCKNVKVYVCGNGKYRCKETHKYFTVKTNTVFDGTKVPLHTWFVAIFVYLTFDKDFQATAHYLQKRLDVTPRTVWLLLDKIRYAINHKNYKRFMNNLNLYPHLEFMLQALMTVPRKGK